MMTNRYLQGLQNEVRPLALYVKAIGPAVVFGVLWQKLNGDFLGSAIGRGADSNAAAVGAGALFWYCLYLTGLYDYPVIARKIVTLIFAIPIGRIVFSFIPPFNNTFGGVAGAVISMSIDGYVHGSGDGRFVHARGTVMLTLEEAKKRIAFLCRGLSGTQVLTMRWAGNDIPESISQGNLLVAGFVGTGKTRLHRELMGSIFPRITPGSDMRALVYDVKSDFLSELETMGISCEFKVFNPFDTRSVAWDIAADVNTPNAAQLFAEALILESPNDKAFFTEASRNILAGVINKLNEFAPGAWTLRDLIALTAVKERTLRILAGTDVLELYKKPDDTFDNTRNTIGNATLGLQPVAALWERASEKISLKQWVRDGRSILVFGGKEDLQKSLEPLNRVAFKMVAQEAMSGPESPQHSRLWFFCDELKNAGRLDALPLMLNGRSKGVRCVLGFQDIEGLIEAYGNEHRAMEVLNRCGSVSWLRLTSPKTAQWASDRTGAVERWEYTTTQTKDGTNTGESLSKRDAVMPSEFMNLSDFDGRAYGVHRIRGLGGVYNEAPLYPIPSTESGKDFMPRDTKEQELAEWTAADDARFQNDDEPQRNAATAPIKTSALKDIGRVKFGS